MELMQNYKQSCLNMVKVRKFVIQQNLNDSGILVSRV